MSADPHTKAECDLGGCDICLSYWELLTIMMEERRRTKTPDHLWPSIVLIEKNVSVPVPMRTLAALLSYALAGPTNGASIRARDKAIEETNEAIVTHFNAWSAEGAS